MLTETQLDGLNATSEECADWPTTNDHNEEGNWFDDDDIGLTDFDLTMWTQYLMSKFN